MVFNIGDIVLVDNTNKGYIYHNDDDHLFVDEQSQQKRPSFNIDTNNSFTIKYLIGDYIEKDVHYSRLSPTTLATRPSRSVANLSISSTQNHHTYKIRNQQEEFTSVLHNNDNNNTTSSSCSSTSNNTIANTTSTTSTRTLTRNGPFLHATSTNSTTDDTTSIGSCNGNRNNNNTSTGDTINVNSLDTSTDTSLHHQQPTTTIQVDNTTTPYNNQDDIRQLQNIIDNTFSYTYYQSKQNHGEHPLFNYLKTNNETRPIGWLVQIITESITRNNNNIEQNNNNLHSYRSSHHNNHLHQQATIKQHVHLNDIQRHVLVTCSALFSGFSCSNGPFRGWKGLLLYAFGYKCPKMINRINKSWINNKFDIHRKIRKDKGCTIFNDEKKRKTVFSPFQLYKKRCYEDDTRDCTARICKEDIKERFLNLSAEEQLKLSIESQEKINRAEFLWEDIKDVLLKTKGKVSYIAIKEYLKNIICVNSIRKLLNSKEGYRLRRDRILPHLEQSHKEKRFSWAKKYIVFWSGVSLIPSSKIIYVKVHMDEKWFYACRTQGYCKVLESIGLLPADFHVHHKCHIGKEMMICVTAFILNNNDVRLGGEAVPIALVRVGMDGEYKRNTYHRVYDNEGHYTMPSEPWNLNHKKGDYKFITGNLTGSTAGYDSKGVLNVSLLEKYQSIIIPALEEKIVQRLQFNEHGEKREVRIVLQEDGAGPHNEVNYNRWMNDEFERRDWIRFNQPPQSPVTNVHDACIFAMLSRCLSREQAIVFGSRVLVHDQIHETVRKCFFDPKNVLAMSRAFAANHQLALAIIANNGDNNYLKERGGLSFGIRRSFTKDPHGGGIIVYDCPPLNESQTRIGMIRQSGGLKYKFPNVCDDNSYEDVELDDGMKNVLSRDFNNFGIYDDLNERTRFFWREKLKPKEGFTRIHDGMPSVYNANSGEEGLVDEDDSFIDWQQFEPDEEDDPDYYNLQPIVDNRDNSNEDGNVGSTQGVYWSGESQPVHI